MELPSKKIKDLTGQKFNNLTVIGFVEVNHNGASVWNCECDCGKKIKVTANHLQRGQTKSCGCLTAVKSYVEPFEAKGLLPLEKILGTKHKVACVDGEGYKYYLSYDAVKDKRTKEFNKWSKNNPFKAYNMRLYASKIQENCEILSSDNELKEASNQRITFICPDCGEPFTKKWCHWIAMPLNRHVCPSCNDRPVSAGVSQYNRLVNKWLTQHNLPYIREKTFPDLCDIKPLRFDYEIYYNSTQYLIEVDGPQHDRSMGWCDEKEFAALRKHDKMKDEYCKTNNINLLRLNWRTFRTLEYQELLNKTFFD